MESHLWNLVAYGLFAAFGGVALTTIGVWCWMSLTAARPAAPSPNGPPPVQDDHEAPQPVPSRLAQRTGARPPCGRPNSQTRVPVAAEHSTLSARTP